MRHKTTHVYADLHDPDARPALDLTPLAFEDFYDIAAYTLTPAARAEIALAEPQAVTLDAYLLERLQAFTAARIAREKARGDQLYQALADEEAAACNLAFALEYAVNKGL